MAGVGAARGGSTREHGDGGGKQEQHLGVLWRLLCKLSGRSNQSWGTVGSKLIGSARRVTLLAGQVMEAGPRVL